MSSRYIILFKKIPIDKNLFFYRHIKKKPTFVNAFGKRHMSRGYKIYPTNWRILKRINFSIWVIIYNPETYFNVNNYLKNIRSDFKSNNLDGIIRYQNTLNIMNEIFRIISETEYLYLPWTVWQTVSLHISVL